MSAPSDTGYWAYGGHPTSAATVIRPPPESDDSLRARLSYVAGGVKEPHVQERIQRAFGAELDRMANEYGIKRRES